MSAELMRLLANILRVGVVAEVNPKTWLMRRAIFEAKTCDK